MLPRFSTTFNKTYRNKNVVNSLSAINPITTDSTKNSAAAVEVNNETSSKPKTGILMMNLGGSEKSSQVYDFLNRLFSDKDLIPLGPLQKWLGPLIAKRRTPSIIKQYDEIGGGSPIKMWTEKQGEAMVKHLDEMSPSTAP